MRQSLHRLKKGGERALSCGAIRFCVSLGDSKGEEAGCAFGPPDTGTERAVSGPRFGRLGVNRRVLLTTVSVSGNKMGTPATNRKESISG